MRVRRGGGRWLMVLACLPVAALVLATTPASANGAIRHPGWQSHVLRPDSAVLPRWPA